MNSARVDRQALRSAYRMEEGLEQAADATRLHPQSKSLASKLTEGARKQSTDGLDDFLNSYGLATEEGIALIVDSSALPEQVTRDVMASAFQSAGQRRSALRVLYLQESVADTMLTMIKGAFEALVIGDPANPATDVGPVIDAEAKDKLEAHIAEMEEAGFPVWWRELPEGCAKGHFVAPTIIEIGSILDLDEEHFGPVLHVVRYPGDALKKVIDDINSTGYGLTLGLHSRIAERRRYVESHARVGNFYVNRNQIGAVVGSQPFGSEGLSGTGPKAGGPHYVARFAAERVTTIDTTAAGGNASLLAGG